MGKRWDWLDASAWDEIALASPGATWVHRRAWAEAIAGYDPRFESRALGLRLGEGDIAALPLVLRRGTVRRGPLARAVSTQPGTYGGPILKDRLLTEEDWRDFLSALANVPIGRIDVFGNVQDPIPEEVCEGLVTSDRYTQVVELAGLPEDPTTTYRRDTRVGLRRAEDAGIVVRRIDGHAELEAYYKVYADRVVDWGKDPEKAYPLSLFEALMDAPGGEVWCAFTADGGVAAGGIYLFTNHHCAWWQGAFKKGLGKIGPSKALLHRMIVEARDRGCDRMDFNPSSELGGVQQFKRGFRPTMIPFKCWQKFSPVVSLLSRSKTRN